MGGRGRHVLVRAGVRPWMGWRATICRKIHRLGVTVALPVNRYTSVKLYGSTGVSTRTGSDFDAVGILVQYRWGGGL